MVSTHSSTTPTTNGILVGFQTIDGPIVVKPQGTDDGWLVTVVENRNTMELFTIATQPGYPPHLTRRLLGSRHTADWSSRLPSVQGMSHAERVTQVVRMAKGQSLTHGTEAA